MEKFKKIIWTIIIIIIFVIIGINNIVRVGQGPNRPSKGIIMNWITK